jgi:hypothetical protein
LARAGYQGATGIPEGLTEESSHLALLTMGGCRHRSARMERDRAAPECVTSMVVCGLADAVDLTLGLLTDLLTNKINHCGLTDRRRHQLAVRGPLVVWFGDVPAGRVTP